MLPVRVLLVDDDTLVRRAVRQILEAADDLEVVGEASDGDGAGGRLPRPMWSSWTCECPE